MEESKILKIVGGVIYISGLVTIGWYSHPMVAFGAFIAHWGLNIDNGNRAE